MQYDLIVKNGTIVDGTGRPRFHADVAVAGDRIVEIGKPDGGAKRVIDASDLVVAPGFIDPHTHYDAQICWDPMVTCSSWHGVTTVIMGNCGVGIAPCRPQAREIATWDLVNVEAIPFEVLNRGITWEWETFPQFMDAASRRGSGINLGFLAPLTPFRHYVMGEESFERAATPQETVRIRALIKEAVAAGAMGFSISRIRQHIGYRSKPLASRLASVEELKSYAGTLKELNRGVIELALGGGSKLGDADFALLEILIGESTGHVTWLSLTKKFDLPNEHMELYQAFQPLIRRGGRPQICAVGLVAYLPMRQPFAFSCYNCFHRVFNQPPEVIKQIYRDPAFRQAFREELKIPASFHGKFDLMRVIDVKREDLKHLIGKSAAEIAQQRGQHAVDTILDLAIEDDLNLGFTVATRQVAVELLDNPDTMIGISDGGAHVGVLCDAGYPTEMLGRLVREKQLIDLETAIRRMTSEPAQFFGITDRGQLLPGYAADLAIFDSATVNSVSEQPEIRFDLPGGGRRMVVPAQGMEYTIVNGQVLYEHQQPSGAMPGRVLRSAPF